MFKRGRRSWVLLAVLGLSLGAGLAALRPLLRARGNAGAAQEARTVHDAERASEDARSAGLHPGPSTSPVSPTHDDASARERPARVGSPEGSPPGTAGVGGGVAASPQEPGAFSPWHSTLGSARAEARRSGRVILAYVGLDPAACPPCERLNRELFQEPTLRELAQVAVLWKVRLDDASLSIDDRAVVAALGAKVLPALIVLTSELGVLHRQHSSLYPAYSMEYLALDEVPEALSSSDLIRVLEAATQRAEKDATRLAALSHQQGASAHLERARLLASQDRVMEAAREFELALLSTNDPTLQAELSDLYARASDWGRAISLLRGLVQANPDAPQVASWQVRLLSLEYDYLRSGSDNSKLRDELIARIRALVKACERPGRTQEQARARLLLAEVLLACQRVEQARPELELLVAYAKAAPANKLPASWLWSLLQLEGSLGAFAVASDLAERLYREYPLSMEAQLLKHGVLDQLRRQAKSSAERPY